MFCSANYSCLSFSLKLARLYVVLITNLYSFHFSIANNMMGESMSIVTEKRVGELQAALDELKRNWIDPSTHNHLKKDLQDVQDSREIFQVNTNLLLPHRTNV